MGYKFKDNLLPRSILSSIHEPVFDPKDGHGARSRLDVIILRKWNAAKQGDDDELIDLVNYIVRADLAKLKAARKRRQTRVYGGGPMKIRSLIPVMKLLGAITTETVAVAPEFDGFPKVTTRKKIHFALWFEAYAFGRPGVDAKEVEGVRDWLAKGGIQRPHRGEVWD